MTTLPAAEAHEKSRAIWDEMATGWQRHNDYIWNTSRLVGEWLVTHIDPQPGETVLEIAAGPGDTGFVAAKLVGNSGKLISTDFSQAMVDVARARADSLSITNAEFRAMDAEKMDLADDSVDAVLCRWGFMLMLDPASALRECNRVLRSGGRFAFSVWGAPEKNPWVTVFGMVMIQQGHPPQGDPFGPGGMFSMAQEDTIRSMLSAAGFEDVEIEEMEVRWKFDDFDAVWTFATELAGAIAALVKQLPPDEVENLRQAIIPAIEPYRSGNGYDFPGVTINVATVKP
jgi:ubiquinone/menaquinone biosynthesis C-methylase UbiE